VTVVIDTGRVLARNTAWNYAGFAINLATNLVMFPYVVHQIGDAAAGVWLLLSSVTGYMGLLELGIVPSLTQTIAAALARGDRDAVNRAASSAQAVLVALASLSLALLPAAPALVRLLRLPAGLEDQAIIALRVTVVGFALRMPLATFQGVLLGRQRQDRCNQLWIAIGFAKLAAAVLLFSTGYGLVGLVSAEMIIHLLAGALQIRWVFVEIPNLQLSWRLANREDAMRLLSFGSAILGMTMCSLIIEQTDRLVIATFLPVAMVTYYAAAWKVYMLSYTLTTTLVQAVSPLAADLYGRNDRDGLRRLFLRSTKYTAAVAWPLVLTLAFSGGFLLRVWIGAPFVSALPVVQVLVAGFAVTAHNHAGYSALIGMRRVGPTVRRYFAPQALLNLVLSVWLVQRLGNVGVALGTTIPALALEYFFLRFVLGELRLGWREFLGRAVWPVAAPALVAYLPLAVAYSRTDAASPVLPLVAAGCSAVYGLLVWRFLDAQERAELIAQVPPFVRRRARMMLPSDVLVPPRDQRI
jgi:O-antigen/teichoic acid export membrane protein